MPTPTDINKELQKRIDRYIRKTLKNIKVEAADEFDANFNRQALSNHKNCFVTADVADFHTQRFMLADDAGIPVFCGLYSVLDDIA